MNESQSRVRSTPHMGRVRAAGRVYARKVREAEAAAELLREAVRDAADQGESVTAVASAAGLSRKAVYRAVRKRAGGA